MMIYDGEQKEEAKETWAQNDRKGHETKEKRYARYKPGKEQVEMIRTMRDEKGLEREEWV